MKFLRWLVTSRKAILTIMAIIVGAYMVGTGQLPASDFVDLVVVSVGALVVSVSIEDAGAKISSSNGGNVVNNFPAPKVVEEFPG